MDFYKIIIFIVPGFIYKYLQELFFPSSLRHRHEGNTYYYLMELALIGFFNMLISHFLIINGWFVFELSEETFGSFFTNNPYFSNADAAFIVQYGIVMLIALIFEIPLSILFKKLCHWLINAYRTKMNMSKKSKHRTVWDHVFEKSKSIDFVAVDVEQDGKLIDRGILERYSEANDLDKEFQIRPLKIVLDEFQKDIERAKRNEDLVFDEIDTTYFNMSTGTVIRFYNMSRFDKLHPDEEDEEEAKPQSRLLKIWNWLDGFIRKRLNK